MRLPHYQKASKQARRSDITILQDAVLAAQNAIGRPESIAKGAGGHAINGMVQFVLVCVIPFFTMFALVVIFW